MRIYLAEETHGENKHCSITLLAAVEKLTVIPPALVRPRNGNVFDHFLVFELHDWRVSATLTVILGLEKLLASGKLPG
jgi:hypothetical protein